MNKIERIVHQSLEGRPALRNSLKIAYQAALSLVPTSNINAENVTVRRNSFYGFHNTCPWSSDSQYLLTHKFLTSDAQLPEKGQKIQVGVYRGDDYATYENIAETRTWNWQQGSMLQWLGKSHRLIFNDWKDNVYVSRVLDVSGDEVDRFNAPVSAVSPDGSSFVSFSYSRLGKGLKGYGYAYDDVLSRVERENDRLLYVNVKTGEISTLLTLQSALSFFGSSIPTAAHYFFSHCLYSPSGRFLMLFLRWKRFSSDLGTRVIIYDLKAHRIDALPLGDFVSHASWVSDSRALIYAENIEGHRAYYLVSCSGEVSTVGDPYLTSDGHPQVLEKADRVVTDTYPDRYRMQKMYTINLNGSKCDLVVSLKIPFRFRNEVRCDFHPRWDREGKYISFDSAHTGVRSHCTIRV